MTPSDASKLVKIARQHGRIQRIKPLKHQSDSKRQELKLWEPFKRAIFERDAGKCFWCGRAASYEEGTVEHASPEWKRTDPYAEAGANWIHHKPWPRSCHGAKSAAGARGQVVALEKILLRYDEISSATLPVDPTREDWIILRNELLMIAKRVQNEINDGRRSSLLEVGWQERKA